MLDFGDNKFYTGSFKTINRNDFTKSNSKINRKVDVDKDRDFKHLYRESVYKPT